MRHGRLPWFTPDELDAEQRAYYEKLLSGPRDMSALTDSEGRLHGAFNARLLDPPVGTAIQELGAALRFHSKLDDKLRELTILTVASHERCDFEWNGHAAIAKKAGLTAEQLEGVRAGNAIPSLSYQEELTWRVAKALLDEGDLAAALFAEAMDELGPAVLFDIVSLVGYYRHTAMAMRVWQVPLRPGDVPVFGG